MQNFNWPALAIKFAFLESMLRIRDVYPRSGSGSVYTRSGSQIWIQPSFIPDPDLDPTNKRREQLN
jgi:hypothetical protein